MLNRRVPKMCRGSKVIEPIQEAGASDLCTGPGLVVERVLSPPIQAVAHTCHRQRLGTGDPPSRGDGVKVNAPTGLRVGSAWNGRNLSCSRITQPSDPVRVKKCHPENSLLDNIHAATTNAGDHQPLTPIEPRPHAYTQGYWKRARKAEADACWTAYTPGYWIHRCDGGRRYITVTGCNQPNPYQQRRAALNIQGGHRNNRRCAAVRSTAVRVDASQCATENRQIPEPA